MEIKIIDLKTNKCVGIETYKDGICTYTVIEGEAAGLKWETCEGRIYCKFPVKYQLCEGKESPDENGNCIKPDVMQQSELLIDFLIKEQKLMGYSCSKKELIDKFIKSINSA